MSYISRIPLSGDFLQNDACYMHAALMSLFPPAQGGQPRTEFGVLWTYVEYASGFPTAVLVQSAIEPSVELSIAGMPHQKVLDLTGMKVKTLDEVVGDIRQGDDLVLNVTLSRTVSKNSEHMQANGKRPKVVKFVLGRDEAIVENWVRKAAQVGLEVNRSEVLRKSERRVNRRGKAFHEPFASIQSIARVTDPEAVREALRGGIGRGKAYGCGMMLARVLR